MVTTPDSMHQLVDAIQALSQARNQDDVMDIVRHAARALTQADGATFVLRDRDFCFYAEENALSPLWKGQRFPMSRCISGWVMLNGQTVILEDIYADPRIPADAYRPTFVKSLVMVPIRKENPIGAIGNYWAKPHRATQAEVELLEMLANAASIAMENVKVLATLEERIGDLQAANRAKDEFLQVMSHELRTPLNGIVGWARLLEMELQNNGALPHGKLGIETISRCAQSLTHMIDDLLDTNLIMAGKLHLDRQAVSLPALVQSALESVRPQIHAKGLTTEFSSRISQATVLGDRERLFQVLANLLSNAIKFTPAGGTIRVSLEQEGPAARITVEDNGEGIEPEALPRIFDRFMQANSSTTRKHGGMGLGLTIVKHLVEAHGGRVDAASQGTGKGAQLSVWLPLQPAPAEALSAHRRLDGELSGVRVLAVDDNWDARMLLATILEQQGAEVRLADGAREAGARLQEFSPDVLICDLSMPEVDGFSLLRNLDLEGRRPFPAIAFTAFADDEHRRLATQAGFDAFLAKPFDPSTLVTLVSHLSSIRKAGPHVQPLHSNA